LHELLKYTCRCLSKNLALSALIYILQYLYSTERIMAIKQENLKVFNNSCNCWSTLIFCSEIWVKIIFGWPTFKIMCNTPIFYQLSMSNWKPGEWLQALGSL
jgi:hypothetical protein